MKLKNTTITDMIENNNERLILFGAGIALRNVTRCQYWCRLFDRVSYIVDNQKEGSFRVEGRDIPIYKPEKLYGESRCSIVIMSFAYAGEIIRQLEEMNLPDDIDCYVWRMITYHSAGEDKGMAQRCMDSSRLQRIERTINTFWFSGEKIPEEYQFCVDSWERQCPDFKIRIWTLEDYEGKNHPFFKAAIDAKKWAFAADYARMDMIYHYGGIYMDMDIELRKPLDCLLGNSAFFSFNDGANMEPAIFGAERGNAILGSILEKYERTVFDTGRGRDNLWHYCLPNFVSDVLNLYSIKRDGRMQILDDISFLPQYYLDNSMYDFTDDYKYEDKIIAIHHCNGSWVEKGEKSKLDMARRGVLKMFSKV